MAEGLRRRAKRKACYYEQDDSEDDDYDEGKESEEDEAFPEPKSKSEDFCTICKTGGKVLCCDSCTAVYHLECLDPPIKAVPKGSWSCPICVDPLADIEKILDCQMREVKPPRSANDEDEQAEDEKMKPALVKQYLIKWKSRSYLHCTWIPLYDLERASRMYPGLRMKLNHFNKQFENMKAADDEDQFAIRSEWVTADRIIDRRHTGENVEYLVKWKELGYDEATWEVKDDIIAFKPQIEKYKRLMAKGARKPRKKADKTPKSFSQYEETPSFVADGGILHPYQLEGLNFLRFAWQQEKHVILADEMGLGKTIQSIAFLASLLYEGLSDPHLVVAPLSTLRNWEREFATWAPHIQIVVYAGNAKARSIIRDTEFYYPAQKEKTKKKYEKKSSKQDRIKFDVLLTSYEMITCDSSILRAIRWECLIVDEGHRLKSKESKLFQALQNYNTHHRVLLTGTPLQNNLDELFTLMHFLDASKFSSLDDFQQEFRDINQEEQVRRLHKMLASHLLRRVKKDVLKQLPPKKELMLRVELSSLQKQYYKAILTRNYETLCRKGGPQISLNNVVMELRKLCGHPYMIQGVEPEIPDADEENRQRIEASGKLALLDRMMVRLREAGHRVLIYSQFQHMLDILEEYLSYKNWNYERIDGSVTGAERQIRIDRYNAPNSNRFCFLLSTRAGGLGINLATADTVIIYDSDWNPHADLQAMARAHRLGQKNMVMIFRLVARGSIEERMMQMTKKKMVLEHLVVGRMKTQVLNQEELDDILRYGAKSVFADENDDAAKALQIHYDDAALDRLLERSEVKTGLEMPAAEDDNDLLKAFKVANFEYVNEAGRRQDAAREAEAEFEAENLSSVDRMKYWENLLKERYDHQQQAADDMGKGKRIRKQINHGEDDLAGMEYSSSDEENVHEKDADYKAEGKPRKLKVETPGRPSLVEGDGKSLKVLGFRRKHRALFVKILMRFGLGDASWSAFAPHFEHKRIDEIREYGALFLTHIAEEVTDLPTFSDGVPKEGLRIQDVLIRVAVLHLMENKIKQAPTEKLFYDPMYSKFPALRSCIFWREEHDRMLLEAILKHGYGRWSDILEDPQYGLHLVLREELRLPPNGFSNGHAAGAEDPGAEQQAAEMKRVVEFVKKRVSLLEKVLNAERHVEDPSEPVESAKGGGVELDQEPRTFCHREPETVSAFPTPFAPEEVLATAIDNDPKRLQAVKMYNEMCAILSENRVDAFQTYGGNKSAGIRLRKGIRQLDQLCIDMRRALSMKGEGVSATGDRDDFSDPEPDPRVMILE